MDDFWRELMEGESNHGRKRSPSGIWEELGIEDHQVREEEFFITYTERREPLKQIKHGTLAAYNNDGCRCDKCRRAVALYRRTRRLP